jgi:outer membrane protein OmpA-like peptidoglycan-associated protein
VFTGLIAIPTHGQLVKNRVIRRDIQFPTANWTIPVEAVPVLNELCTDLANRDNYRIMLIGNTDSVGNNGYNTELSRKRAIAVREHLIACGAAEERFNLEARSFHDPKANNATEEGKEKNRRTTVVLTLLYASVSALEPVENLRPGSTFDLQVLFKFKTAELLPGATQNLDQLIVLLNAYPDLRFELFGWVAIHQRDGNDLSGDRAKAVYDYLAERGIAPERMQHKGMGGAGCTDSRMLEKCRRVEIAITRNPYLLENPLTKPTK